MKAANSKCSYLYCKIKNKDCPVLTTKNGDFVLDRENDNVDNRFHKNDSLHPPPPLLP